MMLRGKEKIYWLITRILDQQELTPKGTLIGLDPKRDLGDRYDLPELLNIISKLEKEENAIKLVSLPYDQNNLRFEVRLLKGFNAYVKKLRQDPKYQEWSGYKPPEPKPVSKSYFDRNRMVDLSLSSEQNKDRYISVGQIKQLQEMPETERQQVLNNNLTEKHREDMESYKEMSLKLVDDAIKKLTTQLPKLPDFDNPTLSDTKIILPPNYQAETVGLLKKLVEQKDSNGLTTKDDGVIFTVSYSKNREIILNGLLVLGQPRLNGENDQVFSYLMNNPNITVTKKQIEEGKSAKITKDFHKIIENLGFRGDLAKVFFSASKNTIRFNNPISNSDLSEMRITLLRLNKTS